MTGGCVRPGTDVKRKRSAATRMSIALGGDKGHVAARAWGVELGKGRNVQNDCSDCEDLC